jgi:hypothetical protein
MPFNKDIRSCVNLDGSAPYILSYSKSTGLNESQQGASQVSREERIKQEIDKTDSKDFFIKALPKVEHENDIRLAEIIQQCTGENSFLNNVRCISVDELTQNLAKIGELPPQMSVSG